MKHTIIITTSIMLLFCSVSKAQKAVFEDIRALYQEAQTQVLEADEYHAESTQVAFKRMIPALGSVHTTVQFFGDEKLSTDEASTNPWQHDGKKILKLVSVSITCACSAESNIEYLFNPENGALVFVYQQNPIDGLEYKFYYQNNQLIRYLLKNIPEKDSNQMTLEDKYKAFTPKEMQQANSLQEKAATYVAMFEDLYAFEKLEKRMD